ncbi:MAG: hypothetical protein V5A55_10430 [Halovenus sp.]
MSQREQRDFVFNTVVVVVLSAVMGVILNNAWATIYRPVKGVLSALVAPIPGLAGGGVQFLAVFGLTLYLTWTVIFGHDVRKRYQGAILLAGSIIVLVVLAFLGTFLPNIEMRLSNVAALFLGIFVGIVSESIKTPVHEETGRLRYFSRENSSLGAIRTTDGELAEFPAAMYGLFILLMMLILGGVVGVLVGGAPVLLKLGSVVLAGLYARFLLNFLNFEADLSVQSASIEILGPTGSGKTLFLIGLYQTLLDMDEETDVEAAVKPKHRMSALMNSLANWDPDEDGWPVTSTPADELRSYGFEFTIGRIAPKRIEVSLTDHSGRHIRDLPDVSVDADGSTDTDVATDGGSPSEPDEDDDEDESRLSWMSSGTDSVSDTVEDESSDGSADESSDSSLGDRVKEGLGAAADTVSSSTGDGATETDYGSTGGDVSTGMDETDWSPDEVAVSGTEQEVSNASEAQRTLKKRLQDTSTLIFLIDCDRIMNPAEFSSDDHADDSQESVVGETEKDDADLAIEEMEEIVSDVGPDDVILVASKADYLIDRFKEAQPHDYAPHEPGADYAEFTEFVTEGFAESRNFQRLMNTTGAGTIHPVYFETEERNGRVLPKVAENDILPEAGGNDLRPVGFHLVIREIKRNLD